LLTIDEASRRPGCPCPGQPHRAAPPRFGLHLVDDGEDIRRELLDAVELVIWLHLFILASEREQDANRQIFNEGILALFALTACGQSFEVASVKLGKPPARTAYGPQPGGERYRASTLSFLVDQRGLRCSLASDLRPAAGVFSDDATTLRRSRPSVNRDRMMPCCARCWKTASSSPCAWNEGDEAYALVVAKGAPKWKRARRGNGFAESQRQQDDLHQHVDADIRRFARVSSEDTVVDQTGLRGVYNFTLNYMPERLGPGILEGREPAPIPTRRRFPPRCRNNWPETRIA